MLTEFRGGTLRRCLLCSSSPWRTFIAGLLVTLGNPKIMMFYLALLPTIIDLSRIGTVAWFELTLAMLIVLMAVDFGWALLATRAG
ncbi:threonine/homoserine/homoserine lactone efflux protein [Paraburkholderia sp. GAS32]